MNITEQDRINLERIHQLISEANTIYDDLLESTRNKIRDNEKEANIDNEDSLVYVLRRAETAIFEARDGLDIAY